MQSTRGSVSQETSSINIGLSKTVREIFSDPLLKENADLNESAKKKYIDMFLRKECSPLGNTNVESVYQRIKQISYLDDITNKPLYLMMALHVLPYIESFYDSKNQHYSFEVVQKDVMHLFTEIVLQLEAGKIFSETGTMSIGRDTVNECIFTYTRLLAKAMCTDGFPLDEITLTSNGNLIMSNRRYLIMESPESQTKTIVKCFRQNYDPTLYRSEEEYQKYKVAREGCVFLKRQVSPGSFKYSFIHNEFVDYFAFLTPQSINGRRREIVSFLKAKPGKSFSAQQRHDEQKDKPEMVIFSVNTSPATRVEDINSRVAEHQKKVEETYAMQRDFIRNNPGKSTGFSSSFTGLSINLFTPEKLCEFIEKEREKEKTAMQKDEDPKESSYFKSQPF